MTLPHIVIIGAGPAGLVALKTILATQQYTATVYETSDTIGGTFRHKTYDDGALVSSRLLTAFSDFRFTGEASKKDHPSIPEYLEYLEQYADHFNLYQHIHFQSDVTDIQRSRSRARPTPTYTITIQDQAPQGSTITVRADAVCICSGLHNIPNTPRITDFQQFTGHSFHSSQYKERSIFKNQRVLVVGAGETGLDIAYRSAIAKADSVLLSARSGFLSVPHEWYKSAPLDSFITNLCECAYSHRWVEYWKIKWNFTTPFIRAGFLLGSGTSNGWNQWALTKTTTVARGHHIINKSVKAMAYINRPLKQKSFLGRWLYSKLDDETDPECPDIDTTYSVPVAALGGKRIALSDGSVEEFDTIVFATGYKQKFPFLFHNNGQEDIDNGQEEEDEDGDEDDDGDDPLPNVHNIIQDEEPTLSFIGFVRPNVGAIPPMAEIQVMWWLARMSGQLCCSCPPSYHLMNKTNKRIGGYAVDYGAYMHDLAREMGSAPDLFKWLWTSPKVGIGYALGQSYPTYFCLEGPYMFAEAQGIAENELWEPVVARPWVTNVVFVLIIALFGVLNGACVLLETLFLKQF